MKKTKLTGRIVTPEDPEYDVARINLNLSLPKLPCIIVFCQNTQDVCNTLKWARERHIPFRVRSGRHNYENFSLVNRGLIIDVSEMNRIIVQQDSLTATIEAGADLGAVYKELWKYGVTLPAGTSASVGIVGLTLGGGIGMLSRLFGLTCDQLLEIDMVQAVGKKGARFIRASERENADLFWACCGGGGGNFGIVTSLTFRVHPIQNVSIFSLTWEWKDFITAFQAWQNWAPYIDERLTSSIELFSKQRNKIEVKGEFVGHPSELLDLLAPVLQAGTPSLFIEEVPYIQAVEFFNSGNIPEKFKRSGSYVYKTIPLKGIQVLKHFLSHAPNSSASVWHQSLVGAVEDIAPSETAYFHRKAIIAQEYLTSWKCDNEEEQNIRWIKDLRNAMAPYTLGDYVNWPDIDITDWQNTYYGTNFTRLRKVKTVYDPCNVFRFPQSIPPFHK
ncbi:FAD-binding oxidoreductase [Bacillus pseudomycoides]|uniref:FAD-binding oxidoreductase n=1 Tax=Bacillus pseudomycoides TaxID=64104 RepID=UPI000BF5BB6C|nr:FAD-binding oxidoreductase [Bacillus pseudomycoides]PEP48308.1 FAD-binding protein [Bacillus pseudomycoides]PGS03509.1 FAD-binding protein [Bacillus pseudomycoides]PHC96708.1 FAD-binding protein [Bacillus pseudomycoides]